MSERKQCPVCGAGWFALAGCTACSPNWPRLRRLTFWLLLVHWLGAW